MLKKLLLPVVAALIAATVSASALVLWSSSKGDINIPGLGTSTIDGMAIGNTTRSSVKATTIDANDQISSSAGAPTIASGECGATTNGSVTGTNQSGKITIGAATTTTCKVRFSKTLAAVPKSCVAFPASAGAAATGTTVASMGAIDATSFTLIGSALASTVYNFSCL